MNNIIVSVLVTFYNQERYVDTAISSIINQKTYFNYEILGGDDGSTDHTVELINKWIKQYPDKIKLYTMKRDDQKYIGGFRASKNRLNLLKYIRGKYFVFLDGDDFFCNDSKLQKQVEILDNKYNQDCVACGHNMDMLFSDGTKKSLTTHLLKEKKIDSKKYWSKYYFHTDSLMIRSNIIKYIPVELLENNFNDNLITYSVIQYGKIYYIPEIMAVYRQTGDGVWTSGNKIENCIRNMFVCDLCYQINPEFNRITAKRFFISRLVLIKNRSSIREEKLQLF